MPARPPAKGMPRVFAMVRCAVVGFTCALGCHRPAPPLQRPAPPPDAQVPQAVRNVAVTPRHPTDAAPRRVTFPTLADALRAMGEGQPPETLHVVQAIDVDGDGTQDRVLVGSSDGVSTPCILARQAPEGWTAEALQLETADHDLQCLAATVLGGRVLVPVTATGHDVDEGPPRTSDTWTSVALFAAEPGRPVRNVWEHRVETNNGDAGGGWVFSQGPEGSLQVAADLGDDTPPGTHGPMYGLLVWHQGRTAADMVVGWQTPAPVTRAAYGGCSAVTTTAGHLRMTQTLRHAETGSEIPAGTHLTVLGPGTIQRGRPRLYWVVTPTGERGWAFLLPTELTGCPDAG